LRSISSVRLWIEPIGRERWEASSRRHGSLP
jgi:hypothetical protein